MIFSTSKKIHIFAHYHYRFRIFWVEKGDFYVACEDNLKTFLICDFTLTLTWDFTKVTEESITRSWEAVVSKWWLMRWREIKRVQFPQTKWRFNFFQKSFHFLCFFTTRDILSLYELMLHMYICNISFIIHHNLSK